MPNELVVSSVVDRRIVRHNTTSAASFSPTLSTCVCCTNNANMAIPRGTSPVRAECYWRDRGTSDAELSCSGCGRIGLRLNRVRGEAFFCPRCMAQNYTPCWGCERPISNRHRRNYYFTNNPERQREIDSFVRGDLRNVSIYEIDTVYQTNPHYRLWICRQCEYVDPNACEICHESGISIRSISVEGNDTRVCENCDGRSVLVCNSCSNYGRSSNMFCGDGDTTYCRPCYDSWPRCSGCSSRVEPSANRESAENCQDCVRSEISNHLYSYNTNPLDYLRFIGDESRHFLGVELELEYSGKKSMAEARDAVRSVRNDFRDIAILKNDGSLNCGIEIVSAPITLEQHQLMAWDARLEKITHQFKPDATCGLHVHTSRNVLSSNVVRLLSEFVFNSENYEFIKMIARREDNSYCIIRGVDPNRLGHNRYYGLNTTRESTVEFRMFSATTQGKYFYGSLEFVDAITRFAMEQSQLSTPSVGFSIPRTAVAPLTTMRVSNFLNFVERLDDVKYANLKAMVAPYTTGLGF